MAISQRQRRRSTGAGDLNQQVQFRMYLKGRDNVGGEVKTWFSSNSVFAKVDYGKVNRDPEQPGRKHKEGDATFTVYYRQAIRTTWRLLYRDQEYEIKTIRPDADNFLMEIDCTQQEPNKDDYFASPADGYWSDGSGNYWVSVQRGPTTDVKPTFGNLTWSDGTGNSWSIE